MIPSSPSSSDVAASELGGFLDGASVADVDGAVIVSVELVEFAPGVTEEGEKEQVGTGAGPARAQLSWMALVKGPYFGAMVTTSVTLPPGCSVRLEFAGVKANPGSSNSALASALSFLSKLMLQVPLPEQAPPQPTNVEPVRGVAVKCTYAPSKVFEQTVGQLIPGGELTTVPLPSPSSLTWTVAKEHRSHWSGLA